MAQFFGGRKVVFFYPVSGQEVLNLKGNHNLRVIGGQSHPALVRSICDHLDVQPGGARFVKFSNENIMVQIAENVRGCDVFVVQTSAPPVNEGLMELLIMVDALKHASAGRITAVLPYFPYVRSDKKDKPRISITARLVADLLTTSGVDHVLTMDLHSEQILGFFRTPADQLTARRTFIDYWRRNDLTNYVVVSPDAGHAKRGRPVGLFHLSQ